jgi:hypothetical protein
MKIYRILFLPFFVFALFSFPSENASPQLHFPAREIKPEAKNTDSFYFSRPVAIAFDEKCLFILDSETEEIKSFSKSGDFLYSFGRKGQGPGEFQMPSDMDILGNWIFVADGANRRIQILDKKGSFIKSFNIPFWPQCILALEAEKIVLGSLPSGFSGQEKVLHCFNARGELLWQAIDSYFSGDTVYDLMRNRVFLRKGTAGDFFFIRSSDDRIIRRMNNDGAVIKEISVSRAYPLKEIAVPLRGGRKKNLPAFCWNCAVDAGRFYLLVPQFTPERDLGPGQEVAVIDGAGNIEAFIDLPAEMTRIAVDGERIYGLDVESRLRFLVVKK